ncbi:MAG: hypothetical protein AB8H03_02005 [Saprospiraceae bacterium]
MKTRKILLNVDLVIQGLLIFAATSLTFGTLVSTGESVIFLGFVLLGLGGWQLGSGVIMGIILKDNLRAKYFFGSVAYLIMISGVGSLSLKFGKYTEIFLGSAFIVIIPLCIAFWYLRLTNSTLEKLNKLGDVVKYPDDLEDVLDSEEIFKPIEN